MHFSQLKWPGSERKRLSSFLRMVNRVVKKVGSPVVFTRTHDHRVDMVSPEQVMNFQHLCTSVIHQRVPGDFAELGCFVGSTAAVISSVLRAEDPERAFHVYDSFGFELGMKGGIKDRFLDNFKSLGLPLPILHEGDFYKTVPAELPERIAFFHLDCGVGGDPAVHAGLIAHCLGAVYPRLSPGAVGIFMDYYIPGVTVDGFNGNSGVRGAVDAFFADKPEKVFTLYGGPCSHGWVRKQ